MFRDHRALLQRAGRKVAAQKKQPSGILSVARTLVRAETEYLRFEEAAAAGHAITSISEDNGDDVPYWLQADPSLHSPVMMRRRLALRNDSSVVAALDAWWDTAMQSLTDEDAPIIGAFGERGLSRSGYDKIYLKIFRCMLRELDEAEAMKTLDEDWKDDSGGSAVLTREQLLDALFQLVDVWTEGVSPEQYSGWLLDLLGRLADGGMFKADDGIRFHPDYDTGEDHGDEGPDNDAAAVEGSDDDESARRTNKKSKSKGKKSKDPRRSSKNRETKEKAFSAQEIQKRQRGKASRKEAGERKDAAVAISAAVKGSQARKETKKAKQGAVKVQALVRGRQERRRFDLVMQAVVKLQAAMRRAIARRRASAANAAVAEVPSPSSIPANEVSMPDFADRVDHAPLLAPRARGLAFPGASTSLSARQRRPPPPIIPATPLSARLKPVLPPLVPPAIPSTYLERLGSGPDSREPLALQRKLEPLVTSAAPAPAETMAETRTPVDFSLARALREVATSRPRLGEWRPRPSPGALSWYNSPVMDWGPGRHGAHVWS